MIFVGKGSRLKHKLYPAFTIVELLIVVVVIAILAAITIVAFNGITNRAKVSAVQSTTAQAGKKALLYSTQNAEIFPTEITYRSDLGLPSDTSSATYNYYVSDNRKSFCISVTDATVSPSISNAVTTSSGGTVNGRCVKNLVANPGFEGGALTGWTVNSAYTAAQVVTNPNTPDGTRVQSLWRTTTGDAYANYFTPAIVPGNSPYSLSYWVWSDASTTLNSPLMFRVYDNATCCTNIATNISNYVTTTTPTRVYMSGTTSANPTTGTQIILRVSATTNQNIYYDGFMVVEGLTQMTYGDGNSTNWAWTGSANASTSFGPSTPL